LVQRLIAFFGADGTGKTTHADLLVAYFQSHNVKVRKVWIRSPHTLAYIVSVFFEKINFCRLVTNPFGKKKKYPAVHLNRLLRFFWSLLEFLSVIPVILIRIYIPLLFGYTVVAERYVADTIVTIAYYINDLGFLKSLTARILLCFIPENTLLIHLDSDYSTLLMRRSSRVEAQDFIEFQRKGYNQIGDMLKVTLIDTSNINIEQTFSRILDKLELNKVGQR